MSRKFLSDTPLAEYERLMQEPVSVVKIERTEHKTINRYTNILRQYLKEYGYKKISSRIMDAVRDMPFDGISFLNQSHRNRFYEIYHKRKKSCTPKGNLKIAVIYLLSADTVFETMLENYIANPRYVLTDKLTGEVGEEAYNIYHAVKMMLGMPSGLTKSDLLDNEVLADTILCIVMNAKLISRYGVSCFIQEKQKKKNNEYINNSGKHRRQRNSYNHNGKCIRIK